MIPDSIKTNINERALNSVNNVKSLMGITATDFDNHLKDLRLHQVEWQRKFSLSFACLVLFFIGAPLGSIIRKGGLGMPIVVALIFFMAFHLLNMFGEKFVKNGDLSPFTGMWLPIIVLSPIGAFLSYKATRDSQLFSKEFYYRSFKSVRNFIGTLLGIFKKEKVSSN